MHISTMKYKLTFHSLRWRCGHVGRCSRHGHGTKRTGETGDESCSYIGKQIS